MEYKHWVDKLRRKDLQVLLLDQLKPLKTKESLLKNNFKLVKVSLAYRWAVTKEQHNLDKTLESLGQFLIKQYYI